MSTASRLIWQREAGSRDPYALRLANPEQVDPRRVLTLLERVARLPATRRIGFSREAEQAFRHWLSDPAQPLTSQAYARLSNWFLTRHADRESQRGLTAGELWDVLFLVRPGERLTPAKGNNGKILPERFELWWESLRKAQEHRT
jgi:hypothetical protein